MATMFVRLIALLIIFAAGVFFFVVPGVIDRSMNKVVEHEPYPVSEEARTLHATLRVADLHDDALLWDRDFLKRNRSGHTDAPRLIEGGFRLQVLAAVTKTPKKMNYEENAADTDNITLLTVAQRWPMATWTSLPSGRSTSISPLMRWGKHTSI